MGNPLCHFELITPDPDRLRKFYGQIFDWNFDDQSMPGYTLIHTGAEPTGGLFRVPDGHVATGVSVYFQVPDIDAALQKAVAIGGRVAVPKTLIPNVGHFAMIADPDGTVVGIMQPGH